MSSTNKFFALENREQQGPYTEDDLLRLVENGSLDANCYLWQEGWPEWKRFADCFPSRMSRQAPPPLPKQQYCPNRVATSASLPQWAWAIIGCAAGIIGLFVLLVLGSISAGTNGGAGTEPALGSTQEFVKSATMQAWQALQAADNQLQLAQFASNSARFRQQAYVYSTIDLSNVDPLLQGHIQQSISTCTAAFNLCAEIESKFGQLQQAAEAAAGLGALFGAASSNGYNPQGDAAAGAFLFGLMGAAAQEEDAKRIQAQYQVRWQNLLEKLQEMNQGDKLVAEALSKKFGVPFTDPF